MAEYCYSPFGDVEIRLLVFLPDYSDDFAFIGCRIILIVAKVNLSQVNNKSLKFRQNLFLALSNSRGEPFDKEKLCRWTPFASNLIDRCRIRHRILPYFQKEKLFPFTLPSLSYSMISRGARKIVIRKQTVLSIL